MAKFLTADIALPMTRELIRRRTAVDGWNLKRHITESKASRWRFDLTLVGSHKDLAAVLADRDAQGLGGTFDFQVPQSLVTSTASNVRTSAARAAGSTAIPVTLSGDLLATTLFTLPNDPQLYEVAATRTGDGTLAITPGLSKNVATNVALSFNPTIKARYSPDGVYAVTYSDGLIASVSVILESI